jgi:hypothetical protein
MFPVVRNEPGMWAMFFACSVFLAIQFVVGRWAPMSYQGPIVIGTVTVRPG